jgi:hypothetical protein
MKQVIIKSAIALSLFIAAGNFSTATAAIVNPGTIEMIKAGSIDRQPVYQLQLNNTNAGTYKIVVKDEFGVVLYEEKVNGTNIVRNYQLNTDELGRTAVIFEVFSNNGILINHFTVNNNSRKDSADIIARNSK